MQTQLNPDYFGQLIDEKTAADYHCYSVRALQNWRERGGGRLFIKVSGRSVRYTRRDLLKWIAEKRVANTSTTPTYACLCAVISVTSWSTKPVWRKLAMLPRNTIIVKVRITKRRRSSTGSALWQRCRARLKRFVWQAKRMLRNFSITLATEPRLIPPYRSMWPIV